MKTSLLFETRELLIILTKSYTYYYYDSFIDFMVTGQIFVMQMYKYPYCDVHYIGHTMY